MTVKWKRNQALLRSNLPAISFTIVLHEQGDLRVPLFFYAGDVNWLRKPFNFLIPKIEIPFNEVLAVFIGKSPMN